MNWKLLGVVIAISASASAGVVEDLKHSCFERASLGPGFHWTEQCLEDVFTLRPFHPAIQTIAPGTGPAFGVGFDLIRRRDRLEWLPTAAAVRSTDGSTLIQGGLTIALPPLSLVLLNDQDTAVVSPEDAGYNDTRTALRPEESHGTRISLVRDYWQIDSKLSIVLNAQWVDMRQQDYYGLGPLTSRSGLARYHQKQTTARFAIDDPIMTWANVGFSAKFMRPHISGVASPPSIEPLYSESTAPGLATQPDFMEYEPYLRFRLPVKNYHLRLTEFRVGYQYYQDLDSGRYSFRRLSATVRSEQDIRLPSRHTASHRSAFANFVCPELRSRKHCTAGTLSFFGLVDASYAGANSVVPFYLDETLGGADLSGNDTLRGFVDYRFRAPSRMLLQAEYRHRIWGPIGFLAF